MNPYSFIISLAFVNVSSISTKIDYTKDVVITNEHIQLAFKMNNFTINDKVILNGLEHVIKKIIENRRNLFEDMNNMLVVPEYESFYHYWGEYPSSGLNWDALKVLQQRLRDVIRLELDIPVPEVPDENFRSLVLEELGAKRREFTGIALRNILKRTINYGKTENVTNLINKRSIGTDTENRISRTLAGPERELSLTCMCHIIALFISTKSPESHIKYMQLNPDDTCTLKDDYFDRRDKIYKTYGKFNGQWCQVIVESRFRIVSSMDGYAKTNSTTCISKSHFYNFSASIPFEIFFVANPK
ncbi:uncharacterized protein LOC126835193 [Adelges cooleyi]|uniref:uncharacterized protein LOC126835193 n=1 Tax=Adelges cooleyi TaxID=133065 RepID=UPI0021804FFE|nr:uncharacterized protein LOC126835193 [Adelges cooleyi]